MVRGLLQNFVKIHCVVSHFKADQAIFVSLLCHLALIKDLMYPSSVTEYKDSIRNKSSVWLDYIEDWNRINQFGMFEEQENNVVLNENSVEEKPCINRESKSDDITI